LGQAKLSATLRRADGAAVVWLNSAVARSRASARITRALALRLASVEIALMLLLGLSGRRSSALRMLLAVAVVYAACDGLGRLWPRRRPFARLASVEVLVAHDDARSFPSRHVASGLAMAAVGAAAHPRLGIAMAAVAWLLGASRVAAGLHYPTDVLAGAVLGSCIGALVRAR
jgi:undecaprenyl-diphosphatase